MFYTDEQNRFEFQQSVDRGDVKTDEWLLKLLPPSKPDVRVEHFFTGNISIPSYPISRQTEICLSPY